MQVRVHPVGERDCVNCGIRENSLFADLTSDDFRLIDQPVHDVSVDANTMLFNEGAPGQFVYMLRHGLVKLVRYQKDGSQRIVRLLAAGDIAGLECTSGPAYDSAAITVSAVTACRMPVTMLHRMEKASPRLHDQLIRKWHEALRQADDFIANLATGSARERVARLLVQLAHSDSACEVLLPSREDMGAMLGVTTESASRAIAAFRRGGVIRNLDRQGRHCTVDVEALAAITGREPVRRPARVPDPRFPLRAAA
jgi:CRP/FNR family transcriptional regulator, anaerobic regulatory protein